VWRPHVIQAAPTAEAAMFFFMTNRLEFSKEFLGRIQLFQGIAELLGEPLFCLRPSSLHFNICFLDCTHGVTELQGEWLHSHPEIIIWKSHV